MSLALNLNPALQLTKENHLNYAVVKVDDNKSVLFVKIGPLRSPLAGLFSVAQSVAANLEKTYGSDLTLCLSGGADSQAMAWAFVSQNIRPKVSLFRFRRESLGTFFNEEDISYSTAFCEKHSLKINYIDFDLDQFYESGDWRDLSTKYECSSPQMVAHFKCLDQVHGVPVLSWNIPNIYGSNPKRIAVPNYKFFSYLRYFHVNKRPGVPYFFLHNPEIFYAAMSEPSWLELFKEYSEDSKNMSYWDKCRLYRSAGFQVINQSNKLTGFENYKIHFQVKYGENDPLSFDRKLREPLEQKINDYQEVRFEIDPSFLRLVKL